MLNCVNNSLKQSNPQSSDVDQDTLIEPLPTLAQAALVWA